MLKIEPINMFFFVSLDAYRLIYNTYRAFRSFTTPFPSAFLLFARMCAFLLLGSSSFFLARKWNRSLGRSVVFTSSSGARSRLRALLKV